MAEFISIQEMRSGLDRIASRLEAAVPHVANEGERTMMAACARYIRENSSRLETELPKALQGVQDVLKESQEHCEELLAELESQQARLEEVEAKAAARAAGAVAPPEAPGAVLPFNPELGAALRAELLGHLFGTEELPETPPVAGKDIWEDWE